MKVSTAASWAILAGWSALVSGLTPARADRIRLRGGGEIRGVILPDATRSDRIQIQTESGVHPLSVSRWQVLEVIAEADPLDDYFAKRDSMPRTADAQHELGLWCEEHKLRGLAETHFRHAVEIDPNHEASHLKLGHVKHEGAWMTYDELREAQGLVSYRGRWIAKEEYEREIAQESRAAEDASRVRQLIPLRQSLKSANAQAVEASESALRRFLDPANVRALVEVFGQDDVEGRLRLARMLGEIPGPESRQALVEQLLREPDATVHAAFVEELARRKEPEATQDLLRALRDRDRARLSRAARALGMLGVSESLPSLIAVLVKVDRKPVFVRTRSAPPLIGSQAGSMSAGSYGGPVLAPGFSGLSGATGRSATTEGASLWLGGGGPARKPAVRMLTRIDRNAEVHEALVTLSGRDFGYETNAWRQWLKQNPTTTSGPPTRRIPQP